ncbi:glycosyltransferase [Glycomyces sp. L485]|uniref:glycosyltransferase n=1 Tax=Glycomyces sp. L485 TaxID=2909235 RepID=UPI001F4B44EC|nr:glycosyltransferase [Glycomyces sp. L485]
MDYASPALRSQFIDDHVAVALRRNPRSLGETAIRFGSRQIRDVLAARAVSPAIGFETLLELLDRGELGFGESEGHRIEPFYLAELARALAVQRLTDDDLADALRIYAFLAAESKEHLDSHHQGMYLHLSAKFRLSDAKPDGLFEHCDRAHRAVGAMLECNRLLRPGRVIRAWLRTLEHLLLTRCSVGEREGTLLSRLEARDRRRSRIAKKVSVIVPVGDAEPTAALRSVLRQNHPQLELLVITSRELAAETRRLVDAIAEGRVIETNQTQYGALVNCGIEAATGELILVLDPDDWCVPHMIETQMRRILRSKSAVAARAARLRATADLRIGPFGAVRPEIHSKILMFRASVVERIGHFDEVGSEALEEYASRIRTAYGKGSVDFSRTKVLALTPDEREFVPHVEYEEAETSQAFTAYRSGYRQWHKRCEEADEPIHFEPGDERPFALPLAMRDEASPKYDLVFASDWRPFGGPAKSMLEEITAARRLGLRIGVMNLEAVRMMAPITRRVCAPVQALVDSGTVDLLVPSDEADIDTLIVRYPLVLEFDRVIEVKSRVRSLFIHANQPPCEADGSDLRYFVDHCEANAERWFGVEPSWIPQGPQARQALIEAPVPPSRLEPFDLPGILDPDEWEIVRDDFRSEIPVLGRHSRDHVTKWPGDPKAMLRIYPDDPDYDFRNMGGVSTPLEVLGGKLPSNWVAYGYDETDVKDFLFQLDFWIYFPNEIRIEAFGRAILEAMASGCVVILPEVFRSTFGEGALYCEPDEVKNLIDKYRADLGAFIRQSRRGQRHVRDHFSYEWYQRLLKSQLLAGGLRA